jgi:phosphate transport system permease protein
LGVGTAIFLREYTRESRISRLIRFGTDCLAGIPSIIFGLFGFVFFVITLNMGWSILSGGLTLAAMILPTIISTTEEAIKAIPYSFREVSYSLGGTRWQTVTRAVLPNAVPGIFTGIILSVGRSIGETAAVILTAGSSLIMPTSLFSPSRTMAVHFYILAREGISMEMAYGTGATLILLVLAINIVANWFLNRYIRHRA